MSRWHLADQCDAGLPGHRRSQQLLEFRERRNSVEDYARAHDFVWRIVKRERSGALQDMRLIIARDFRAKLFQNLAKPGELIARIPGILVRDWHVGRNAMDSYFAQRRHFPERSEALDFGHAHSTHAGVDFEIDGNRPDSVERFCFFDG